MDEINNKFKILFQFLLNKNDKNDINIKSENEQELIDIFFYEINIKEIKLNIISNIFPPIYPPNCEIKYINKKKLIDIIIDIIYWLSIFNNLDKLLTYEKSYINNNILYIVLKFNCKENLCDYIPITNQIYEESINNVDKLKKLINRIENTQLQDKDKKIIKHFPFSRYCNIERKNNELLYKNNNEKFKIFHDGEHSFLFDLLTINDTYNLILNWLNFLKEYFEYFCYDGKGECEKVVPKYRINNNFNYKDYINDLGNNIYINLFMPSLKKKDNYYIFCNCIVLSFNDNKLNIYFDNRNFNNPHINITLFNLYGYKYDEEKTFLKKDICEEFDKMIQFKKI